MEFYGEDYAHSGGYHSEFSSGEVLVDVLRRFDGVFDIRDGEFVSGWERCILKYKNELMLIKRQI